MFRIISLQDRHVITTAMFTGSPLAVLLAAGASRRMGQPKALLSWNGRTLLEAHLAAIPCPVVVVTGAHADLLRPFLGSATEVHNPAFLRTTMGESAVLGVGSHRARTLFIPIDTVPEPLILQQLLSLHTSTVPLSNIGHRGHPVLLSDEDVVRLCGMPDPNLRDLLAEAMTMSTKSVSCALDFDTPQAFRNVKKVLRSG